MSLFAKIWGFYFKLNFALGFTALRFSALRFSALGNTALRNTALRFSALVNRIIAL